MIRRLRVRTAPLHNWGGLLTGWVLYAIVLSGPLSVFRPEISTWMRPELAGRTGDPVASSIAAITWLRKTSPHAQAWYLDAASPRAPYTWAVWDQNGIFLERALDPRTGTPDTIRDTLGGDFFYRFHFQLQLPYPWGRLLAGTAALALLTILAAGIVIHRRIATDLFTFRPAKGQRSWLDAHNLLGVAALPFHLMIALTGAVTLTDLIVPWPISIAYPTSPATLDADREPASAPRPPAHAPGTLAPIGPMLRAAQARLAPAGIERIDIYNPSDAHATMIVTNANDDRIGYRTHVLRIDATTGQILADYRETRPVITTFAVLYGLHVARFAPLPTRWLYFVSGLTLALVIASGLHLWTVRERRQNRPSSSKRGLALVERLNNGMILGTPLAFAAMFLANRALPVHLPNRADLETTCVFATWAAALALAAILPTNPGRHVLGLLTALALAIIAALSAPWTTGVEQGTALVALTGALTLAITALRRPSTPKPRRHHAPHPDTTPAATPNPAPGPAP